MAPKLPEVGHSLPWLMRLLLIAIGIAVVALPARGMAQVLWPPSVMALLAGVIVIGAALIGLLLILMGCLGESQRWSYPPRTVVIHHRRWRVERATRLTTREVASINLRHNTDSEAPDTWRVVLVTRDSVPRARAPHQILRVKTALETRDFSSQENAEVARQALLTHLGMTERVTDHNG